MTQKDAKILVEIITMVVRKELGTFKKQLLQEGYSKPQQARTQQDAPQPTNKLTEVHRNFRKNFKSTTGSVSNKPLSRDPLLNSILQETISLDESESQQNHNSILEDVNLPVDTNGRLISSTANVNHVIEAMNRDYSGMFKPKGTSAPAQAKSQLRSDFLAAMGDDMPEEEDMTWLNEVQ